MLLVEILFAIAKLFIYHVSDYLFKAHRKVGFFVLNFSDIFKYLENWVMWGFIKNNSSEIQTIGSILGLFFTLIGIIIAIVAIWYAKKQIKLFLAQRRFELKLLIQQQLDLQLNTARKIKSGIGEVKKIHNRKMKQGFKDEKLNQAYKKILPPIEVANDYVESIIKVLELTYQFLINDENKLSITYYEEQITSLLKSGQGLQTQSKVVDNIKLIVTDLAGKDL